MIEDAIRHISHQLNQFLRLRFDLNEDIVVISNILEQDGNVGSHTNNKLLVFLVNIEKDTLPHQQPYESSVVGGLDTPGIMPVYLNLHLMFAGNFSGSNYIEALKFISNTVSFFQRRPTFDHQNSPDLHPQIEKLVLEIENLPFHDLGTLWGVLSGKYLPSVMYKVRMVAFDSEDIQTQAPPILVAKSSVEV